uniref:Large ribosomal subunit protein mL40 n=1 Tax=Caligus rogercresseyi TaxID=217165 RepID=C1BQP4_CALRO|nr:39S ribosomal protein L40, mitochondrial precursor [Caligus rogercresseyi]|eukprot:TRINITY_DN5728_c0_g1_i1.p1 TRINITY_DN5728_c0_g1~~TRINITY_DN5728_c0_g1_i1.p1  ORF type:complete len:211 (+),score=55.60 TRINITY_DN5728_c0_g1_i1:30-662(+)
MFGIFVRGLSTSSVVGFRSSVPLWASPMRRKVKLDPAITRAREEKRRRRLAKALRRVSSQPRILRPIKELEEVEESSAERMVRPVPEAEEIERRALILKDWNRHYTRQHRRDMDNLSRILEARSEALEELKGVSPVFYSAALSMDDSLEGLAWRGPPTTLPLGKEHLVDGQYSDVTKECQIHYDDMKAFMEQLVQKKRVRKRKEEDEEED